MYYFAVVFLYLSTDVSLNIFCITIKLFFPHLVRSQQILSRRVPYVYVIITPFSSERN
jgi:hypothetical protein